MNEISRKIITNINAIQKQEGPEDAGPRQVILYDASGKPIDGDFKLEGTQQKPAPALIVNPNEVSTAYIALRKRQSYIPDHHALKMHNYWTQMKSNSMSGSILVLEPLINDLNKSSAFNIPSPMAIEDFKISYQLSPQIEKTKDQLFKSHYHLDRSLNSADGQTNAKLCDEFFRELLESRLDHPDNPKRNYVDYRLQVADYLFYVMKFVGVKGKDGENQPLKSYKMLDYCVSGLERYDSTSLSRRYEILLQTQIDIIAEDDAKKILEILQSRCRLSGDLAQMLVYKFSDLKKEISPDKIDTSSMNIDELLEDRGLLKAALNQLDTILKPQRGKLGIEIELKTQGEVRHANYGKPVYTNPKDSRRHNLLQEKITNTKLFTFGYDEDLNIEFVNKDTGFNLTPDTKNEVLLVGSALMFSPEVVLFNTNHVNVDNDKDDPYCDLLFKCEDYKRFNAMRIEVKDVPAATITFGSSDMVYYGSQQQFSPYYEYCDYLDQLQLVDALATFSRRSILDEYYGSLNDTDKRNLIYQSNNAGLIQGTNLHRLYIQAARAHEREDLIPLITRLASKSKLPRVSLENWKELDQKLKEDDVFGTFLRSASAYNKDMRQGICRALNIPLKTILEAGVDPFLFFDPGSTAIGYFCFTEYGQNLTKYVSKLSPEDQAKFLKVSQKNRQSLFIVKSHKLNLDASLASGVINPGLLTISDKEFVKTYLTTDKIDELIDMMKKLDRDLKQQLDPGEEKRNAGKYSMEIDIHHIFSTLVSFMTEDSQKHLAARGYAYPALVRDFGLNMVEVYEQYPDTINGYISYGTDEFNSFYSLSQDRKENFIRALKGTSVISHKDLFTDPLLFEMADFIISNNAVGTFMSTDKGNVNCKDVQYLIDCGFSMELSRESLNSVLRCEYIDSDAKGLLLDHSSIKADAAALVDAGLNPCDYLDRRDITSESVFNLEQLYEAEKLMSSEEYSYLLSKIKIQRSEADDCDHLEFGELEDDDVDGVMDMLVFRGRFPGVNKSDFLHDEVHRLDINNVEHGGLISAMGSVKAMRGIMKAHDIEAIEDVDVAAFLLMKKVRGEFSENFIEKQKKITQSRGDLSQDEKEVVIARLNSQHRLADERPDEINSPA